MTTLQRLESALCTGEIENLEPKHFACFDAYHSGEFDQALEMATRIFGSESHFDAKAFYLHLICIILEIKYDLPLRAKWMSRWTTLLLDRSSPFATAAKNYHTAVTAYFESHQLDAKSRFKNLAENPDTPARFAALSRFHLGLIHRNENLNGAALIEMHKARELAQTIGHLKLQARITKQITLLSKDIEFPLLDLEVQELLAGKQASDARSIYLMKRRLDRRSGLARDAKTLHAILPAILLSLGKKRSALAILSSLEDGVVQHQAVSFCRKIDTDSLELRRLESHLAESFHRVSSERSDLERLEDLLRNDGRFSKEQICKHVWNLSYDPVLHDGRIYKLIQRFRAHISQQDTLVNRYGSYELKRAKI